MHMAVFHGSVELAQLLAVFGGSTTTAPTLGPLQGMTPADIARQLGKPELQRWLTAVAGWHPLRIAAGCRLHADVRLALKHGRIEPDGSELLPVQTRAVALATAADPVPWAAALPVCMATTEIVREATSGWSKGQCSQGCVGWVFTKGIVMGALTAASMLPFLPGRHWLHHSGVRGAVHTVLLVSTRLQLQLRALQHTVRAFGARCTYASYHTPIFNGERAGLGEGFASLEFY